MNPRRHRASARMFNLVSGAPDWRIQAQTDAGTAIYLYDEISYWGVTAADMVGALAGAGDVQLHIHSPGGDVFEGIAILNVLRAHPGDVHVTVDGLAASAASFVAMAGKTIAMAQNSQMMIHDALMLTIGNQADHLVSAEMLGQASANIASIYAERAGGTIADWRAAMLAETRYTADGAVAAGLADSVLAGSTDPGNTWDVSVFKNSTAKPIPTTNEPALDLGAEIRRAFEEAMV